MQVNKAMLNTYLNSAIAAAVALYMAGNTNPTDLLKAAVAAVAPTLLRALNPKDKAYGFKK
jgi:hypothetical protein